MTLKRNEKIYFISAFVFILLTVLSLSVSCYYLHKSYQFYPVENTILTSFLLWFFMGFCPYMFLRRNANHILNLSGNYVIISGIKTCFALLSIFIYPISALYLLVFFVAEPVFAYSIVSKNKSDSDIIYMNSLKNNRCKYKEKGVVSFLFMLGLVFADSHNKKEIIKRFADSMAFLFAYLSFFILALRLAQHGMSYFRYNIWSIQEDWFGFSFLCLLSCIVQFISAIMDILEYRKSHTCWFLTLTAGKMFFLRFPALFKPSKII